MASPGKLNPPAGGPPFDMHNLFKPSSVPPPAAAAPALNPNHQGLTGNVGSGNLSPNLVSAPFPPPSSSYPPPTGAGTGAYYSPQASPFHYHPPSYAAYSNPPVPHQDFANVYPQRSLSYPAPPLQPQLQTPSSLHQHNFQNVPNAQNPNNPGARLMALLSAPPSTLDIAQQPTLTSPQIHTTSSSGSDFSAPQNANVLSSGPGLVISHQGPVMRMLSSKLPKGRHLIGDNVVYDIDVRLPGEVQPQLEVTPITKYGSDPELVVGRQIAVNKNYICYGLKLGAIRVLNINTASRALLKGLAQRVTDMVFFAEDVHLLASASVDGRIYVWKITEGQDEEDKPQITGRSVIAVQITGAGGSVHPKVCWHCHKQEVLVVGIGRHVLKIDSTRVGRGEKFSAEEPLKCPIEKLIDGIQLVGSHDGEVTDLSMCQWMTTRLVSASVDGTIKIWEDRKTLPIAVLRPHDNQSVNSVTFLAAPNQPDHIILITGGPLNRELKIWVSESEEGWLLPSDAESWHCAQTLLLKSSESRVEEAFFNQVVALSEAGLILLANARRNAIYAVHLEYGPNPAATRLNYIAEFSVTMPILSFTGTSELQPHGDQIVQVYCVQTQAIQQYALDLAQCLPPPQENAVYDKSESSVSQDAAVSEGLPSLGPSGIKPAVEGSISSSAPEIPRQESGLENPPTFRYPVTMPSGEQQTLQEFASSIVENRPDKLSKVINDTDASAPLPLSPQVSKTLSGFRSLSGSLGPAVNDHYSEQKITEYLVDRQMVSACTDLSDVSALDDDSRKDDNKLSQDDISRVINHPIKFKHPTHLVTPSEILMARSSSEVNHTSIPHIGCEVNFQDVGITMDPMNVEVDVKVVGETRCGKNDGFGAQEELQTLVLEARAKSFCSQTSDLGLEMARESHALSPETYVLEETRQFIGGTERDALPSSTVEAVLDSAKDINSKVADSLIPTQIQQPAPTTKVKKQKGKIAQGSVLSSPLPSALNSTYYSGEPIAGLSTIPVELAVSQIRSMQDSLNQLLMMQKEIERQMAMMVAAPVINEGKRLEAALGKSMEKVVKANIDALWAHFREENAKQEKAERENIQQLMVMITNCFNKDLPAIMEKTLKRELNTLGQSVARIVTPSIDRAISTAIAECFQKGIGDKAINQLERSVSSKLESLVAKQIQAQFQTSGKQALQETLKSSLEASVIPSFEMSCRTMFEQIDASFQKGMLEHTAATQQQFEASHSPLALALRDALNSAASISQTIGSELLDGQRNFLALAVNGSNPRAPNALISQLSNGPLGGLHEKLEVPLDPTKELSRLVAEHKFEEAFTTALQRSDVAIVSWLCSQVNLPGILSSNPLPLSQGVLLSLLQQLACDLSKETHRKLTWMREILSAINPTDPIISVHVRPIFEQVYQILNHHRNIPMTSSSELSSIRLIMHVINSMLMSSK